jgi:TPR repeat protein
MKHFTILLLFIVASTSARADLDRGLEAYLAGDYKVAFTEFSSSAESGDTAGKHLLASLYYQGQGVRKDVGRAFVLFKEAADHGYRASQANLGLMYHRGDGIKSDIKEAVRYYQLAAGQGDVQSRFNLGQIYRKGEGVPVDYRRAASYYRDGAAVGHIPSVNEYGLLFAQGQGVDVDYVEAYGWIAFAASKGDAQAEKNLKNLEQLLGADLDRAKKRAHDIQNGIQKTGSPGILEPTRGIGAVLFFQSRWPRVAQL